MSPGLASAFSPANTEVGSTSPASRTIGAPAFSMSQADNGLTLGSFLGSPTGSRGGYPGITGSQVGDLNFLLLNVLLPVSAALAWWETVSSKS